MNARLRIPILCAMVCLLPMSAIAQDTAPTPAGIIGNMGDLYKIVQKRWIVAGKVTTLRGDPVAGARVDVEPTSASGQFRTLVTDFQGQFQTDYWLNSELVKNFLST